MNQNDPKGQYEFVEYPALEGECRIPNKEQEELRFRMTHVSSTEDELMLLEGILSNPDLIKNIVSVYDYCLLEEDKPFEKDMKKWFDDVYFNFRAFDVENRGKVFAFVAMKKIFLVVVLPTDESGESNATIYAGEAGSHRHIVYNNLNLILHPLFGEE